MQNSLESVYETLSFSCLPDGWYYSPVTNNEIQCFQITRQPANLPPVIISRLILIQRDMKWKVYVFDHLVSMENDILAQYNSTMTSDIILPLIYTLNNAFLCPGNVDSQLFRLTRIHLIILSDQLVYNITGSIVDGIFFNQTQVSSKWLASRKFYFRLPSK